MSLVILDVWSVDIRYVWLRGEVFLFKQKTAYEMRISDWSSDVCSSDLFCGHGFRPCRPPRTPALDSGGRITMLGPFIPRPSFPEYPLMTQSDRKSVV